MVISQQMQLIVWHSGILHSQSQQLPHNDWQEQHCVKPSQHPLHESPQPSQHPLQQSPHPLQLSEQRALQALRCSDMQAPQVPATHGRFLAHCVQMGARHGTEGGCGDGNGCVSKSKLRSTGRWASGAGAEGDAVRRGDAPRGHGERIGA